MIVALPPDYALTMTDTTKTDPPKAAANGTGTPPPAVPPRPRSERSKPPPSPPPAPEREPAPAPQAEVTPDCDDCEPGPAAKAGGLLVLAVAGGLAYIGLDILTGGAMSRWLGGGERQ